MRITKNKPLTVLLIGIIGLLLVACGQTDEPTPQIRSSLSALDINRLNEDANATSSAQTAVASTQLAVTANPVIVPSATTIIGPPTLPPNATFVTLAVTPTVVVELSDTDVLGNIIAEQSWLSQPFTTTDGETYMMESFEGSVIMVQVFTQNCDTCLDQMLNTLEIAQKFVDEERGYDIVYVALNVDTSTSTTGLQNWSRNQNVETLPDIDWYVANASTDLINALSSTFGDNQINSQTQNTPAIIVDMDGYSHIGEEGVMSVNRIRDVLIYYADPPTSDVIE